ncbi:FimV/HubP family polar landmark protein [Trinickia sp. EG282A]|uniref:FimV/HubP family polar landmark protein n=1 Tax=Trinickia sp. EG282A TaxID=3237013 RepID=UPI0034D1B2C3
MTVRSTLRLRAVRVVARSTVAACALLGALGSSAARADDAASAAAASVTASAATQYTVKPGQSLNDVAIAATQSHDKAILARAAKAIFDANPSAFMRGDPSLMKLGAVLNVPPLDASGAPVAGGASAPSASSAAVASAGAAGTASATASHPASAGVAAGASASAAQKAAGASAGQSASASLAPASTAAAAASSAAQSAPHSQGAAASASAPLAASGTTGHAWTGTIQSAPATSAQAPASGTGEAPAVAAPAPVSATGSTAVAPTPGAASSATGAAAAPVSGASPASTPHPRFSSLQQLLALKNRVLMDLQRHGFASKQSHESSASSENAASGATGAPQGGSAPQAGMPPAPVHVPNARGSAVGEQFIGIGDYGIRVPHGSIPVVAAVASAVVAALLVLAVGFSIGGRKRRAARAAASAEVAAAGGAASTQGSDAAKPFVADTSSQDPVEAEYLAALARTPTSKRALMGLAGHYAERRNIKGFDEIAQRIWHLSGGQGPNWLHIASLGRQLDPDNPLFAPSGEGREAAAPAVLDEREEGVLPEHSAAAEQRQSVDHDAKPAVAEEGPPDTSSSHEQTPHSPAPDEVRATSPAAEDEPPAVPASEAHAQRDEQGSPVREETHEASAAAIADDASTVDASTSDATAGAEAAAVTPDGRDATEHAAQAEADNPPVANVSESEPPHTVLPAEAVDALNDLDMALPPRAEGYDRSRVDDVASAPDPAAGAGAADSADEELELDESLHSPLPEEQSHLGDSEIERARASDFGEDRAAAPAHEAPDVNRMHDGQNAHEAREVHEAHEPHDEPEGEPMPPPPAVAGLGAARFGGLNLAFDLDLPGDGQGSPTTVATPAQPMFSAEQIAKIARNKLELAHEYIALGDVGGARTLIHEVIESNDAGTRAEAHALLATLAPLS